MLYSRRLEKNSDDLNQSQDNDDCWDAAANEYISSQEPRWLQDECITDERNKTGYGIIDGSGWVYGRLKDGEF